MFTKLDKNQKCLQHHISFELVMNCKPILVLYKNDILDFEHLEETLQQSIIQNFPILCTETCCCFLTFFGTIVTLE